MLIKYNYSQAKYTTRKTNIAYIQKFLKVQLIIKNLNLITII